MTFQSPLTSTSRIFPPEQVSLADITRIPGRVGWRALRVPPLRQDTCIEQALGWVPGALLSWMG